MISLSIQQIFTKHVLGSFGSLCWGYYSEQNTKIPLLVMKVERQSTKEIRCIVAYAHKSHRGNKAGEEQSGTWWLGERKGKCTFKLGGQGRFH